MNKIKLFLFYSLISFLLFTGIVSASCSDYSYRENADSNVCEGSFAIACENFYDGNWGTISSCSLGNDCNVYDTYQNLTKFEEGNIYQLGRYDVNNGGDYIYNISFPNDCIAENGTATIKHYLPHMGGDGENFHYCWNFTNDNWTLIADGTGTQRSIIIEDAFFVCEDGTPIEQQCDVMPYGNIDTSSSDILFFQYYDNETLDSIPPVWIKDVTYADSNYTVSDIYYNGTCGNSLNFQAFNLDSWVYLPHTIISGIGGGETFSIEFDYLFNSTQDGTSNDKFEFYIQPYYMISIGIDSDAWCNGYMGYGTPSGGGCFEPNVNRPAINTWHHIKLTCVVGTDVNCTVWFDDSERQIPKRGTETTILINLYGRRTSPENTHTFLDNPIIYLGTEVPQIIEEEPVKYLNITLISPEDGSTINLTGVAPEDYYQYLDIHFYVNTTEGDFGSCVIDMDNNQFSMIYEEGVCQSEFNEETFFGYVDGSEDCGNYYFKDFFNGTHHYAIICYDINETLFDGGYTEYTFTIINETYIEPELFYQNFTILGLSPIDYEEFVNVSNIEFSYNIQLYENQSWKKPTYCDFKLYNVGLEEDSFNDLHFQEFTDDGVFIYNLSTTNIENGTYNWYIECYDLYDDTFFGQTDEENLYFIATLPIEVECSVSEDCSLCMKCADNFCVNQTSSEDIKNECEENCDGLGVCSIIEGQEGYVPTYRLPDLALITGDVIGIAGVTTVDLIGLIALFGLIAIGIYIAFQKEIFKHIFQK